MNFSVVNVNVKYRIPDFLKLIITILQKGPFARKSYITLILTIHRSYVPPLLAVCYTNILSDCSRNVSPLCCSLI